MSQLTPGMEAALSSGRALVLAVARFDLNSGETFGLLTGSGEVLWDGVVYRGRDEKFGSIVAIDSPADGFGDEAPGMGFSLVPGTKEGAVILASASQQGSRVRWWIMCLDDNGAVIADPWTWYDGTMDVPEFSTDRESEALDISLVSEMEKLFLGEEGRRLSEASHREIWPDERGMQYVTGMTRSIIWGPGERPAAISYGATPAAGGGYGGGGYGGRYGSDVSAY